MIRTSILVLVAVLLATAAGQEFRLAVVASETGPAAAIGRQQAAAARAFAARLGVGGGTFGRSFELFVEDDGSDPGRAAEIVEGLVAAGMHAVVCCTTEAANRRVAPLAEALAVLTLSPARIPTGPDEGPHWHFSLAPSETTLLRSIVLHAAAREERVLALMTIDNGFGQAALATLERELTAANQVVAANLELRVVSEYRPDVDVLTPEALWVATRDPQAVIVWGLRRDSLLAIDGLRRRGYRGPIYVRPAVLDPASGGVDLFALDRVQVPLAPVALFDTLDPGNANAAATRQVTGVLASAFGPSGITSEAATILDALGILVQAVEQAVVYGVPAGEVPAFRQAVRDAAIGADRYLGGSGSFDLTETSAEASNPDGLVIGLASGGRLVQAP